MAVISVSGSIPGPRRPFPTARPDVSPVTFTVALPAVRFAVVVVVAVSASSSWIVSLPPGWLLAPLTLKSIWAPAVAARPLPATPRKP